MHWFFQGLGVGGPAKWRKQLDKAFDGLDDGEACTAVAMFAACDALAGLRALMVGRLRAAQDSFYLKCSTLPKVRLQTPLNRLLASQSGAKPAIQADKGVR